MNTYRLRAHRSHGPSLIRRPQPQLTADAIQAVLPGATIRPLAPAAPPWVGIVVELALNRSDHAQALDDISSALGQLGWRVAESYVQEWATAEVEGLLAGLGGGGIAGATSRNGGVALLAAAIVGFVGYVVGSQRHTLKPPIRRTGPMVSGSSFNSHRCQPANSRSQSDNATGRNLAVTTLSSSTSQ